jgi:hypothetical protein
VKSMNSILVMALTVLTIQATQSTAYGRGFCNVDHYGDEENRKEAQSAAAQFYGGSAKLMQALAAFELQDNDAVYRYGKEATEEFSRSSQSYASAIELFKAKPGDVKTFGDLNPNAVAAMADTGPDSIARLMEAGVVSPDMLLARCKEEAEKVAAAVDGFLSNSIAELRSEDFSSVLGRLSDAFTFGSVVSASFAYASGERPKQPQ